MSRTILLSLLIFGISVFGVHAQPIPAAAEGLRIEVSDDGWETARLSSEPAQAQEALGGGPFPAVPDWQNDLRRQVGGLAVTDIDGDGDLDVVAGCYSSNSFPPYDDWHNFIYRNIGGELEAAPSWISSDEVSTGDIQVGDFNGDTFPDIFAANGGTALSSSVIYFGAPGGPSTTPAWQSVDNAWNNYALPFDFDHDGDLDVVTANQGRSQTDPFRPIYLFVNDEGVLETTPSWQSQEVSIQNFLAFGDLDGDGWEDLAVSKWANFESGVYRNAGGTLEMVPVWTTGEDGTDKGVGWADVDGNEDLDLVLGHSPTRLYTNVDGTLSLTWSASGTFFGHSEIRWEDVDRDGDQDLAEIHFANGHVNLYLNDGGTLGTVPVWTYDSSGAGTALAFGDLNGDSYPDLVVGNSGDPSVMVFYNRTASGVPLFSDGFESGDLSAWTGSSP